MSSLDLSQVELPLKEVIDDILYTFQRSNPRNPDNQEAVPYLQGKPGGGKTMSIKSSISRIKSPKGWGMMITHLPLKSLEELTGIPRFKNVMVNEKEYHGTEWTIPDDVTALMELSAKHDGVVWVLDDFHLAGREHLNICFELLTNHRLKGYPIPDNVHIMLAGNNSTLAGAKPSLSAIINRCVHYPVVTKFTHWKTWAVGAKIHPSVIAFLNKERNRKYFHSKEDNKQPWASPREWEYFSTLLKHLESRSIANQVRVSYAAGGTVGGEASAMFTKFYSLFSKVNTEAIFDKGTSIIIPDNSTEQYIFVLSMAYEYAERYTKLTSTPKIKKKCLNIVSELLSKLSLKNPDMCVLLMKELNEYASLCKTGITNNRSYIDVYLKPPLQLKKDDPKAYAQLATMITAL